MRQVGRVTALRLLWAALRGQRRPGSPGLGAHLAALPRMAAAAWRGRYPGLSRQRLGLMALAVLYIASPVDLVPESVFLLLGLTDDALVLTWLAGAVLADTDQFLRWEDARRHTVQGSVVS